MKLTKAQRRVLVRLATGDRYGPRCHYMFCQTEASKWVNIWESDKTVVPDRVITALFEKGYYYAGSITEAGRAALRESDGLSPVDSKDGGEKHG